MPKVTRNLLPIPLGSLDQSAPPTILQPGKMASLINVHVERAGSYEPRPGFATVNSTATPTGRLEILSHDNQLLGHDGQTFATFDDRSDAWIEVGKVPDAQVSEVMPGRRDNYNPGVTAPRECDVIQLGTTRIFAYSHYEGTNLYIYCDVIDTDTGARERKLIATTPAQARVRLCCLPTAGKIFVIYQRTSTTISGMLYTVSSRTWSTAVDLTTVLPATASVPWDACADGRVGASYVYLVHNDTTNPMAVTGTLSRYDATLALVNSYDLGLVSAVVWSVTSDETTDKVWVAGDCNSPADLVYWCTRSDLTGVLGATVASAAIGAGIYRIGIAQDQSDATVAHIYMDHSAAIGTTHPGVLGYRVTSLGTAAACHATYNVDMISRPIYVSGKFYAVLVLGKNSAHQYSYRVVDTGVWATATLPELQKTAYLCELATDLSGRALTPARVVCRVFPNTVAPIDFLSPINLRADVAGGDYLTAIPRIPDGATNTGAGHDLVAFGFFRQGAIKPVRYGDVTLLSGGVPSQFDGIRVTELGWNYYPRLSNFTSGTAVGGVMTPGDVYAYCAVYVWVDATGARHWSAPSEPLNVTVGAGHDSITGRVDTLTLTERQRMFADDAPVLIEIYRTLANGTEYHLMTTLRNDPSAAYANFTDLGADISAARLVYTRGGIYPTGCPSCSLHMAVHQGRPWSIPADDRTSVVFGHQALRGEAPRLPDGFELRAADGGKYTALGSLSDKLIAWTANGVDAIYGSGPNQTGQGSSYTEPQPISRAVGATDHKGIVRHPGGHMFAHTSGIWSIGPELTPTMVGSALMDTLVTYPSVIAAVCDEAEQRVVLSLSNGSTATLAAWYYVWGVWSTWPAKNRAGTAAYPTSLTMWRGSLAWSDNAYPYAARAMGTSRAEPDGTFYAMTIKTGWLSPSGLMGYAQTWRFALLGTYSSPTAIGATVGYDYSANGQTTHSWTAAEVTALSLNGRLQLHVDSTRPESEALQLTLVVTSDSTTGNGSAIRLEAITLEAAPGDGLMELADGARR